MLILRCDNCHAVVRHLGSVEINRCTCGSFAYHIVSDKADSFWLTRDDKAFLRSLKIRPEDDAVADEWAV